MSLFDTHVIVDWSARSTPSPRKPSKDSIWWASARDGVVGVPEYARTRHAAIERLTLMVAQELAHGRRVLVGFDFPFGYPAGVAAHLTGAASALVLWRWLAERVVDTADNTNNRYEVAACINGRYPGSGPFWGRPPTWPKSVLPDIPVGGNSRTLRDGHPPERRIADHRAKGAKTVWQLAYSGSVGSQVLVGLPALLRLVNMPQLRNRSVVWPLQSGLRVPTGERAQVVIAEIYPSLLRSSVEQLAEEQEILDRAQVRVNALAFAALDAQGGLAPLFEAVDDLTAEECRCVETEEAWILGLGHAGDLADALRL